MFNILRKIAKFNKYIKIGDLTYLIAYMVDNKDNAFSKYYIENTPDNIASFICTDLTSNKIITDKYNNVVITTRGVFIDIICDQKYLEDTLKPVLIKYQRHQKKPHLELATFSFERIFNI